MSNEPAVVVQKAYDLTLWIIPKVEKFPKCKRLRNTRPGAQGMANV